jgi:hypothetical protein
MLATLFFAFFTGAGAASAPVAVMAPAHHHVIQAKPKRRKFTFPNGITVWATSEALARMFAGLDTLEAAPAEPPAPHLEENPPGDEVSVPIPPPGEPARGNHGARAAVDYSAAKARLEAEILAAEIRAQVAEQAARALLEQARRRRLQAEEIIILQLLMEMA